MYKVAAQKYLTTNVCWVNKLFWLLADLPLCFENPLPRPVIKFVSDLRQICGFYPGTPYPNPYTCGLL